MQALSQPMQARARMARMHASERASARGAVAAAAVLLARTHHSVSRPSVHPSGHPSVAYGQGVGGCWAALDRERTGWVGRSAAPSFSQPPIPPSVGEGGEETMSQEGGRVPMACHAPWHGIRRRRRTERRRRRRRRRHGVRAPKRTHQTQTTLGHTLPCCHPPRGCDILL
jgi:hypothetical protein